MGCDSPDSNFNNLHFIDGQWWATSGWDYSYEGPLEEIQKRLGPVEPPTFLRNGYRWSLEPKGEVWLAQPIGREEDLLAHEAEQARADQFAALVDGVDPVAFYAR
jgi:hypothetical protein